MTTFTESTIEQAAIDWLKELGYTCGPEVASDGVVRMARLRDRLSLSVLMRGEVRVRVKKK